MNHTSKAAPKYWGVGSLRMTKRGVPSGKIVSRLLRKVLRIESAVGRENSLVRPRVSRSFSPLPESRMPPIAFWMLTRAPLDEVKVFVAQCYEDHAKELKLIAEMQKTLNTQYCPVCGTGYDRGLHKCPHCEKIELAEFQKNLKAQRKAQRAEDFNRFMNTADEVIEVGNGFFRCIGKLLNIVFFPIAIIAMFLGACIDAQERGGRRRYSSRRRRRF